MYETFGEKYPGWSTVIVFLLGGTIAALGWTAMGKRHEKRLPQVFLNCEAASLPVPFPPSSTIRALEVRSQPNSGFSEYISSSTEHDLEWPVKRDRIHTAYRCEVANHANAALYAIQASFRVVLKEAVPVSGSRSARVSGPTVLSYEHQVTIPVLEPHANFVFYIHNRTNAFANVLGPSSISCEPAQGTRRLDVRLKQPSPTGPSWMAFPPI